MKEEAAHREHAEQLQRNVPWVPENLWGMKRRGV